MTVLQRHPFAVFLVIGSGMLALETWIATLLPTLERPDIVAFAITGDVLLGLPVLYYFLMARRNHFPILTVVPVTIVAYFLLRLILPPGHRSHLELLALAAPAVEVVLVVALFHRVRAAVKSIRQRGGQEVYAADALRKALEESLGRHIATSLLAAELSLIYFAVAGWFKQFSTDQPGALTFAYYGRNAFGVAIGALLGLVLVEAALLQVVLHQWNPAIAWIALGVHLYLVFWIIGYYQSARLQPLVLTTKRLHLRSGLFWRAEVPLRDIAAVEKATIRVTEENGYRNTAVFGEADLVIRLTQPVMLYGLFGISKQASIIGLAVDSPEALRLALVARMQWDNPENSQ